MIFHAQSPCSFVSACGHYSIVLHTSGFEINTYRVYFDGKRLQDVKTPEAGMEHCRRHADPVPELDLPGWDGNGMEAR